jgi:type I restriction enzyme S subunit
VLEKNSHKLLEIGDFIIEISGGSPTQSTGRIAFITKETLERFKNPLICSNFCKAVTLKKDSALYNFAYEWNRLYDAGVLFGWEGKTSGIKNLLFESFVTNHQVVIPDSKIMAQFYNKAKPIHAQIQTNLKQNQKLSELRDWLLPMLMNGQVTVGEVEEELGMVAEESAKYGKI